MPKVIIGIHGLGNKPPKKQLENLWKLAMIEGLKTNNFNSVLPIFELSYWADIVHEKPLSNTEKDKSSPYFLDEGYVKAPKEFPLKRHSLRRKIVDFIDRELNKIFLNDDFSLNFSALTDTILRKYFNDLNVYYTESCKLENEVVCKKKDIINQRLLETLTKYKNDDIFLISHSMGTIIAYEVLKFDAPEISINTFITMGSPLGLPVVVSKIAAEQKLKNVKHLQTPLSVTKYWYNFSNIIDKVAIDYGLADDFSNNRLGVKPFDFLIVNNYEIKGKRNPHKSYGYLRTPQFAKVLNDFIIN